MKALGFEVPEVTKSATLDADESHASVSSLDVQRDTVEKSTITPELIKSAIAEAIAPLMETITLQKGQIADQQKTLEAIADQPDPATQGWSGLALNPIFKSARPEGVVKQAEIAARTQREINESRLLHHVWRTSENAFEREAARNELDKRGFAE